jgi:GT2 family glycosyltransferase
MTYPKVSIIILNWNGLKDTIDCLESLKKITYPNYEVIVVDNGSKGNDANILEEKYKGYIKVIRNKENLGFAEGNNVAIREVLKEGKSEYILTLNNDTTVDPNFLDELIKCAQKHPEVGSIQAKMIFSWNPQFIDSAGHLYSKNSFCFNRGAYESVEKYNEEDEIISCCAGACLYKKEALEDVKIDNEYFDKDFFASYEDVDLGFRLQWAGWKSWYCPKAIVYHKRGATTGIRSPFIIYHSARNQVWTFFKNFPNSFLLKNFLWFAIAEITQIGLNLLRKRPVILKAKFDAYRNLEKIWRKKKQIKKRVNFSEIEKFLVLKWRIATPFYSQFKKQKDYENRN